MKAPSPAELVDRLAALPTMEPVPREEWEWLAAHGTFEAYEAGWVLMPRTVRVEKLWVLLSGHITVAVDRGVGPRRVTEWRTGDVTGRLPYSRMGAPPGDNRLEVASELLAVHERHFPEIIRLCPAFTAYCVHLMLDRARSFNASALQDEKMSSLGKLAAGLAHELNNPASATVRAAKQLIVDLSEVEEASRALSAASLTAEALEAMERVREACLAVPAGTVLSPLEQVDREDAITGWLGGHGVSSFLAVPLADTAVAIPDLEELVKAVQGDSLEAILRWIAVGCSTRSLALEIQDSATRIADLVAAVKRFTYMDTKAGLELVDVEPGLRDTIRVIASKAKSKGVAMSVVVEPELPAVRANGGELNQVWMNLIDNALDAAPKGGAVTVDIHRELDRVVVCVTDGGPGIAEADLPRIFDPFFTTKPPGQGTGLGLDISQRLIRQYGGEITVESQPGRTTFCVRLPAADSRPVEGPSAEDPDVAK